MDTLSENGKIRLLGAAALILGVAFVSLFYDQELGLNYSLFIALIVALGLFLARVFSRHISGYHYGIMAAGIFFSSMVTVRSGELLSAYNVLGSLLLLLIAVGIFRGKPLRAFLASDYLKVVFLPLRFIPPFFENFLAILSLKSVSGDNARRKEIIRGSIMSAIALLIFAWLFSSADAGFEKLFSHIFTLELDEDLVGRTILGTIVTAFFIGGFGFMFKKPQANQEPVITASARNLGTIETTILLGSINVLFLVFILLQVSYLFGGAEHLLLEGLTYAEYAREGFIQLVVVAILSFLIILFAERQVTQNDGAHLRSFKVLSGVLVLQVIAVLVSAFVRLSLYEVAYGFTDTRLYSHAFMIWLGVVLVLLFVHIWKNGKHADFSFYTFCTVVIFLFGMNVMNPDVFIAKKNLERYEVTGQLDARYLGTLSDDALPYTIHLLDDPNEEISKSFAHELYWRYDYCNLAVCDGEDVRQHSWQSWRWNRTKTEELLAPKQSMLLENKSWLAASSTSEA